MTSYEPASGRNLPPGCRDEDIDREFGRVPTCGDCSHLLEGCCDFGICELEFEEAFDEAKPETPWRAALWAHGWVVDHYKDMQEDTCGRCDG